MQKMKLSYKCKIKMTLLTFLLILILSTFVIVPAMAAQRWRTDVVLTDLLYTREQGLVLDSNDNPYIAWVNKSTTTIFLNYALITDVGSNREEIIDSCDISQDRYSDVFMVMDSNNIPHISYRHEGNVMYAVKSGSTWDISTVDSIGGDTSDRIGLSMAVDSNNNPHISYQQPSDDNLLYAVKTGGVWNVEIVTIWGFSSWRTSIALDSNNIPHISYGNKTGSIAATTNQLAKYAVKNQGAWVIEIFDTMSVGPWPATLDTSLVLDSSDTPHIAYTEHGVYGVSGNRLKYAVKNGGTWIIENVFTEHTIGIWLSIALNSTEDPHIGFSNTFSDQLMYAAKSEGQWNNKIVVTESTGSNIIHTSLVIDSSDIPHILYVVYDQGTGTKMKYVTREFFSSVNSPLIPVVISVTLMATIAIRLKRKSDQTKM